MKLKLRKNPHKGKLIVFEGTDGAGKTTILTMTKQYIEDIVSGREIIAVKQPTDLSRKTKLFQKMMYSEEHSDIDYRAVQLLTMSDRVQHTYEVIEPALKEGKYVICDRYVYTSLANMLARGYRSEKWFYNAAKHLIKPDIVFLVTVPPELAIGRIKRRPAECERYLDEELLRKVSLEFLKMSNKERFTVLYADADLNKEFNEVRNVLKKKGIV